MSIDRTLKVSERKVRDLIKHGNSQTRKLLTALFGDQLPPKLKLGNCLYQRCGPKRYYLAGLYSNRVVLIDIDTSRAPWASIEVQDPENLSSNDVRTILSVADFDHSRL